MKRFAFVSWTGSSGPPVPAGGRARHLENLANAEGDRAGMPETPVVTYAGPAGFPAEGFLMDTLDFKSSAYVDPQGDALAARKWRIGEVHDPEAPGFDPAAPRVYEYPAVWESEDLTGPAEEIRFPASAVRVGHRYRVRSKVRDATGRWSHWSEAVEFVVAPAMSALPAAASLRVTEIMYNPRGDEDYEFIEIKNIGAEAVDLGSVNFALGLDFDFSTSSIRELGPRQYVVVVRNLSVFQTRYDTQNILIAGQFSGRLGNDGDEIELRFGSGVVIQQFGFLDDWYPSTDGFGFSLVAQDESAPPPAWSEPAQWFPSGKPGGSPGMPDSPEEGGLQRPGNINQDNSVNVVDVVVLLRHLFFGKPSTLPCGDGTPSAAANRALLDVNDDAGVDASDAVYLMTYLFLEGPGPAQGPGCIRIPDCPDVCSR